MSDSLRAVFRGRGRGEKPVSKINDSFVSPLASPISSKFRSRNQRGEKEQAIFDIQIIGAVLVGKEYAISWNFMRPIVDLCHLFFAIFDQFILSDHHRHPLSKYSLRDTPVFTLNLNRNFLNFDVRIIMFDVISRYSNICTSSRLINGLYI